MGNAFSYSSIGAPANATPIAVELGGATPGRSGTTERRAQAMPSTELPPSPRSSSAPVIALPPSEDDPASEHSGDNPPALPAASARPPRLSLRAQLATHGRAILSVVQQQFNSPQTPLKTGVGLLGASVLSGLKTAQFVNKESKEESTGLKILTGGAVLAAGGVATVAMGGIGARLVLGGVADLIIDSRRTPAGDLESQLPVSDAAVPPPPAAANPVE